MKELESLNLTSELMDLGTDHSNIARGNQTSSAFWWKTTVLPMK